MEKIRRVFKNYFIPREENGNRPHILRPRAIAFVVMVALVAESAFVFGARYIVPQSKLYGIVETNALVDETNQSRVADGFPGLQVSPLLQAAAQEKANDMATKGYFAHTSPQGLTSWYWFEQVGYNFDYAGENLAVNFSDSQDVTNAWMNSPEHRANILSGDFTQIGIATAAGIYEGHETTYVVEEFGAPSAAPVAFVNTASAASIPATVPVVTPARIKQASAPVHIIVPVKKPTSVVAQPVITAATPVAVVPVVVAMQSSSDPTMQQSFVAVKGAATSSAVQQAQVPSIETASVSAPALAPQSNAIQKILSDPKAMANDFYLFLMVLFILALILNIFIKIRIQYPRLIAGGLLVIVVAGLCIMLNQNIGLLHAVIS